MGVRTRVSIIDFIIKKMRRAIAIVEDTDTASRNIAAGKYVLWKGVLTKASSAISSGTTLSSSNLASLEDGAINDLDERINTINTNLNNVINQIDSWDSVPITLTSAVSGGSITCRKKNGFAYVLIYALTVKNAGDTQSLATGLPAPLSQTGGGFIGTNASATAAVYSSGDCWWIGSGSSTLQGHFGSANGQQHWGQMMYMCKP